jgi:hypothetical protein
MMEYFNGVIFLTTNRVDEFDPAILSRIHLMFKYENLKQEARRGVWEQFIKMAGTSKGPTKISSEEVTSLIQHRLNGRQVSFPSLYLQFPELMVDVRLRISWLRLAL